MMLKVILYAYSQKVYSCRGIETMLQENLPAMWLAAMQQPDLRTINDFRGNRMSGMMDELFEAMILRLVLPSKETEPAQLEELVAHLEERAEELTSEIEQTQDVSMRKSLRTRRSALQKPAKLIRKDFLPRLAKYAHYQETFGDRNSFSKTDPDATFMRMKEDHMKNGQLKPGYNV